MKVNKLVIFMIIILLLVIFVAEGIDNNIEITQYSIKDKRVNNPIKIALLTDMHSDKFNEQQDLIYRLVKEQKPDLIFLSGDIIDDLKPMKQGYESIKNLPEIAPTYYVTGNHEIWSGLHESIKKEISSYGIHLAAANKNQVNINGNQLEIYGLTDPEIGGLYLNQLKTIGNKKKENISLLLAHRPERIGDYSKLGVDYILSGHAHGGQWRIPYLMENGLIAPNQGLFPKYTKGVIDLKNNQKLIVSRGLTVEKTSVPRLYNRPEVVIVTLQNE